VMLQRPHSFPSSVVSKIFNRGIISP